MATKDTKISVRTSSGQVIINFNGCCGAKCGRVSNASSSEINVCKCSPCKCTPVCNCSTVCKGAAGNQQKNKEVDVSIRKGLTDCPKRKDQSVSQQRKEASVRQCQVPSVRQQRKETSTRQCKDSSVCQLKRKDFSASQQKHFENALSTAIEKAQQKKEKKIKKEDCGFRPPSPQPLSLGPLLCGDPDEQVSSMSVKSTKSSESEKSRKKTTKDPITPKGSLEIATIEKAAKTPKSSSKASKIEKVAPKSNSKAVKTPKSNSKAVKKTPKSSAKAEKVAKASKTNAPYFLHQKQVVLNASIDGIPISTNLAINIKSKNKDARVELKEMWVDGERLYCQRKDAKKN